MEAVGVREKKQRRRRVRATAGMLSVIFMVGLLWFGSAKNGPVDALAAPGVAVMVLPERRVLPDGSVVELKDGSEITVDFGGELRRVTLRRGEAHFQVAKNPLRAFVVEAGGMEFRAVGTAFAVQLSSTKVEMLVTEGTVAVDRAPVPDVSLRGETAVGSESTPLALVEAGAQVAVSRVKETLGDRPKITALTPAESGEKLAWRVPRLELDDTPLAEAILAINRHSPVPLELKDAEVGKVGISGVLRVDNVEPLLRMLENNYNIRADRRAAGKILLQKTH